MKRRHHLLMLAFLLTFATAQAQVKVGANPGSLTTGAVLDAEGSSGARTVIMNDGRVGVNTTNPNTSADLELGSGNKALYLNRVSSTSAITAPQPGMVIYDLSVGCVKSYQGNPAAWSGCLSLVGAVSSLNCATARFNPGSATQGQAYSGTLTVPYTGGNGGSYPAQSFTANDLTFSLANGYFQQGNGSLVYTVSGIPQTSGVKSFSVAAGGQSCPNSISLAVNATSGTSAAPTNQQGSSATLSGKTCFDVVATNDGGTCGTLASRANRKTDFTTAAGNTNTYVFKPSVAVTNVSFRFVNTNGLVISGISSPAATIASVAANATVNVTVNYYNNLNSTAAGLTNSNPLTADIYVIYTTTGTGAGTYQQKLTAMVKDCACCGLAIGVNQRWRNWMCHNVGADYTADPFTPAAAIHGAKYQWGAYTGETGRYLSQQDDQAMAGAVSGWKNTPKVSGWSDVAKGEADPCPQGYRLPTENEFEYSANQYSTLEKIGSWNTDGVYTNAAYLNTPSSYRTLMFPIAGYRSSSSGSKQDLGTSGFYWSGCCEETTTTSTSNANGTAYYLTFNDANNDGYGSVSYKQTGASVKCISMEY